MGVWCGRKKCEAEDAFVQDERDEARWLLWMSDDGLTRCKGKRCWRGAWRLSSFRRGRPSSRITHLVYCTPASSRRVSHTSPVWENWVHQAKQSVDALPTLDCCVHASVAEIPFHQPGHPRNCFSISLPSSFLDLLPLHVLAARSGSVTLLSCSPRPKTLTSIET